MPTATLLSSYANKPRTYSLIIGKATIFFESNVPKEVTPSVAARLAKKTEDERDSKGRKTGRTRKMFKIKDMPTVQSETAQVRKKSESKGKSVSAAKPAVKGQRRMF